MKILIMSDIHANMPALNMIAPYIDSVDKVICLGDAVGYNQYVNPVIDFLRTNNVQCIMGNHDHYMLHDFTRPVNDNVKYWVQYARDNITPENKLWLSKLPDYLEFNTDGEKFLCCHASPWNHLEEYIYPDNNKRIDDLFNLQYNVICIGHTHHPMEFKRNNKLVLNPGSVGQSRNIRGMAFASILDTKNLTTTQICKPLNS